MEEPEIEEEIKPVFVPPQVSTFVQKTKEKLDSFINDIKLNKDSEKADPDIPATILNMQINKNGQLVILFSKNVRYPKFWYKLIETNKRNLK